MQGLDRYLDSLDDKHKELLSYWLRDYVRFLKAEKTFDPSRLIRYKRGSIVKVHLGYRIGSEEGGLHYAVVIDVNNARSSQTLTVIPLTSLKAGIDPSNLHYSKIYLGQEVYNALDTKISTLLADLRPKIDELLRKVDTDQYPDGSPEKESFREDLKKANDKLNIIERASKEISKMKTGSIALVGQITTISKIRVFDPLYPADALANIRLSPESLNKIDNKIKNLYTYRPAT